MGGMVAAIEEGFPQREIADSAYRFQQAVERGEQIIVGVNANVEPTTGVGTLYIDEQAGEAAVRAAGRGEGTSRSAGGVAGAGRDCARRRGEPRT